MITEEERKKIVDTVINYILNVTNNRASYRDYFLIGKEIEGMLEILCMELLTEKMVKDELQRTQKPSTSTIPAEPSSQQPSSFIIPILASYQPSSPTQTSKEPSPSSHSHIYIYRRTLCLTIVLVLVLILGLRMRITSSLRAWN
jgi:hypothetical protein